MPSLVNAVVLITGANGGLGTHFVHQAVERGAAKAALWSATNTQRIKLAPEGVHVAALHLGYADTPMTRGVDAPKNNPADVVRSAYDGLEAGAFEILADDISRQVKAGLAGPVEGLYPQLSGVKA